MRGYSGSRQRGRGRPFQRNNTRRANNSERNDRGRPSNGRYSRGNRPLNRAGPDGRTLLRQACGSYRHLIAECPDSWENEGHVNVVENDESANPDDKNNNDSECMFLRNIENEDTIFLIKIGNTESDILNKEARKCAVLDGACSSTVCGESWMNDYLLSLTPEDRKSSCQRK